MVFTMTLIKCQQIADRRGSGRPRRDVGDPVGVAVGAERALVPSADSMRSDRPSRPLPSS
jgi:hypothetical protein